MNDDDSLDGIEITELEDEADVEVVPPEPWHNSDTVAASFQFAANMAYAAAAHFTVLSRLATGQAAHEWQRNDRDELIEEFERGLGLLNEGGESGG